MRFINTLSIRARLLAGVLISAALFFGALWFVLGGMHSTSTRFEQFIDYDMNRLNQLQNMQAEGSQMVIAAAKKVMVPSLKPPMRVAQASAERFDTALKEAKQLFAATSDEGQAINRIETLWSSVRPGAIEVIGLVDQGELEKANKLFNSRVQKDWGSVRKTIQPMIANEHTRVAEVQAQVKSGAKDVFWRGAALGIVALVAGVVLILMVARQVISVVCTTAARLNAIAAGDGDLTQRLEGNSAAETSRLAAGFNTFVEKIQDLIRQVAVSANDMNGIAGSLSSISESTHNTSLRQTEVSTQVATAISQMSVTVQNVAESAQHAASAADMAERQVDEGYNVVNVTRQAAHDLNQEIARATDTMQALQAETEKVGSVLTVIREIADQTNLLALNAAIEAARAGEQGRGFAVVADEVRTLASRTQQSTQEIEAMIEGLQTGARSTSDIMSTSSVNAEKTAQEIANAHEVLAAISKSVTQIRDMNTSIAAAVEEQGAASVEIDRNAQQLSHLADESLRTAVNAEETSSRLTAVGEQVVQLISRFKT